MIKMILLISGILCGLSGSFLLVQIRKIHNTDTSQFKKKFYWLFFGILMLLFVRNTFLAISEPWLDSLVSSFGNVLFFAIPVVGFYLGLYLSREDKQLHQNVT